MKPGMRYRLLLVRHGQAETNRKGAFLGRYDAELTEEGRHQIAVLMEKTAGEQVDTIYTSSLVRARETATMLAEPRKLVPQVEPRLIEQDYGQWDTLSFPEVKTRFPEDFRSWREGNPDVAPTGGEALSSVGDRVMACHRAHEKTIRPGGTMLWVSHAGALQCLICRLLGIPLHNLWPFMLRTGSLTEVEFFDFGPRITRLGWY